MRAFYMLLIAACVVYSCNTKPAKPGKPTAKEPFLNTAHAYLGQPVPGDTPQKFNPPHMVDSGYFAMGRIAFSADGKEFYYGCNNQWFNNDNQKLNYFYFDSASNSWQGPVLIAKYFSQPTFSADGLSLYATDSTVEQFVRSGRGWGTPRPFLKRSYVLYNFMPVNSGRFYVGSNGTWGKMGDMNAWRFAVMPADIKDTSIKSLGEPLNAPGFNGDFYVAPTEEYMIISAKETKDFECELWISFNKGNDVWTTPISLGDAINRGPAHRFGQYVSPGGKYLFYTKGTSEKDCGLYWVRFDTLLQKLRKQSGM